MENQPSAFFFVYPCTLVSIIKKIIYSILKSDVNQKLNQAHTHSVLLYELKLHAVNLSQTSQLYCLY